MVWNNYIQKKKKAATEGGDQVSSPPMFTTPSYDPSTTPGRIKPGNLDITNRPNVFNADGTISTMRTGTGTVEIDGKEVAILYPTISPEGKQWTNKEAQANALKDNFGIFDTEDNAQQYDRVFHEDIDKGRFINRGTTFVDNAPLRNFPQGRGPGN